ncbi:MAG: stalk domain-containing protein, partial [Defluviitaleaceae bacterium]|nr:stalk domain-containing protein [Defluviitaleaceae bacterium]
EFGLITESVLTLDIIYAATHIVFEVAAQPAGNLDLVLTGGGGGWEQVAGFTQDFDAAAGTVTLDLSLHPHFNAWRDIDAENSPRGFIISHNTDTWDELNVIRAYLVLDETRMTIVTCCPDYPDCDCDVDVEINTHPSAIWPGHTMQLSVAGGVAVTWSVTGHASATISAAGLLTVGADVPPGTVLTITATHAGGEYDSTTVTVAAPGTLIVPDGRYAVLHLDEIGLDPAAPDAEEEIDAIDGLSTAVSDPSEVEILPNGRIRFNVPGANSWDHWRGLDILPAGYARENPDPPGPDHNPLRTTGTVEIRPGDVIMVSIFNCGTTTNIFSMQAGDEANTMGSVSIAPGEYGLLQVIVTQAHLNQVRDNLNDHRHNHIRIRGGVINTTWQVVDILIHRAVPCCADYPACDCDANNDCPLCGNDPCTCPNVCGTCGNDPCTCPNVCGTCGNDPCTCPGGGGGGGTPSRPAGRPRPGAPGGFIGWATPQRPDVVRPEAPPAPREPKIDITVVLDPEVVAVHVAAHADLTVELGGAEIIIPADVLVGLFDAHGDEGFEISIVVTPVGTAGETGAIITVDVSISIGGVEITNLPGPITITVPLGDIAGLNPYRILVIDEAGNVIIGSFDPATGDFTFETTSPGRFEILYIHDLRRLVVALDSHLIIDRAGNAPVQVMDVLPHLEGGRTLLPLRFITLAIGGEVDWNDATQTVTISMDGRSLSFRIGEQIPGMDVPAMLIDGRTMIPARFIGEFFGAIVEWDEATRSFEIII